MNNIYNDYRKKLTASDKEFLDDEYQSRFELYKKRIEEGILENQNHLSLINLCANCFQHNTKLHQKTGYRVVLCEPFYERNIKNFDVGVLNVENKTLILIECKYSISDINNILGDFEDAISISNSIRFDYESVLGNKINNIEYVICTDGVTAHSLADIIYEKRMNLITWGCNLPTKELKLFTSGKDNDDIKYIERRVHQDKRLNRELYKGVKPRLGINRMFKITPSLNTGIILTEINMRIKEMMDRKDIKPEDIDQTILYHILESSLTYSKTFQEKDIENLVLRIMDKVLIKDMYEKYEDEKNPNIEKYQFTRSLIKGQKIAENTVYNYIVLNAQHKAEPEAIEALEKSGRLPNMYKFLKFDDIG